MKIEKLSERSTKIELFFGFIQDQNVSEALPLARRAGFDFELPSNRVMELGDQMII